MYFAVKDDVDVEGGGEEDKSNFVYVQRSPCISSHRPDETSYSVDTTTIFLLQADDAASAFYHTLNGQWV